MLGPEVILFDKQQAASRHMFFFPICLEHHWWMYAFHPKSQNLWALDSIFRPPRTEHRKNVDQYAARIIEELVQLALPWYKTCPNEIAVEYVEVLMQPNTFDCGVMVHPATTTLCRTGQSFLSIHINCMQGDLVKMRRRFLLDIVLSPWNACLANVEAIAHTPKRNVPPRNKRRG
ncbi:hypothetical protein PIB30_065802 [Stylosanthes scabra]|uniref:Ubiquitin-like protease family profile domain-containing protein n=1 Tax=Stylosanthes scabra TaxID=79078 RepID=A0ABU6SMM8_9FABA|nr:hypothetical protein [Stylosanthes scabra]